MRWKAEMFVSLFFISEHIVMWSTFKYQLDRLLCLTWLSLATNSCRILETLSAKFANIELISVAYAEFISPSYLCRATFMTNRIHGGKTVAGAIWLLASKLLFIVSFHFFFCGVKQRKNDRRNEPAESVWGWFSFVLTLCYRTPSLVSLTLHTAGKRRVK